MNSRNPLLRGTLHSLLLLAGAGVAFGLETALAADNQPPAVSLTQPADGSTFPAGASIRISAIASDPDGWVQKVEFLAAAVIGAQGQNPMERGPQSPFEMTWANVPPGDYELTARATDNSGLATSSGPVRITVTEDLLPPPYLRGYLRRDVYTQIPGVTLAELTQHPKFPDHPDLVDRVGAFEAPSNIGDNLGTRLSGFLLPPATGDYVFYLASDDQGALFLSPDEDPLHKARIAYEPLWAPPRSWTSMSMNRPNQENVSAPIRLEAGRRYYVEALMKEGGGGDNLGVAWQRPGEPPPVDGAPPISGEFLALLDSDRTPVVTLAAPDPTAAEQSPFVDSLPDTGRFLVHRTGDVSLPLTVHLEIGGSALNGVDYEKMEHQVLIPAGSAEVVIPLNALDDLLVEGTETVLVRVGSPLVVTDPAIPPAPAVQYWIGSPSSALAVIRDDDVAPNLPPRVTLVCPPNGAVFPETADLRLVAQAVDPDGSVEEVEFFAGALSLGIARPSLEEVVPLVPAELHPEHNGWPEGLESRGFFHLVWTNPPPGTHGLTAVARDNLGATRRSEPVEITVLDQPHPVVVSVRASDPVAVEPPGIAGADQLPDTARFTFVRTGPTDFPLPVLYRVSGAASNGVDFAPVPVMLVIPEGARTADLVIVPIPDGVSEGAESVVLTVESPACIAIYPPPRECYEVGHPASARAAILDPRPANRPPHVALVHPHPQESFLAGTDISLVAAAWDVDGLVQSVEFFAGDLSLGVSTFSDPVPLDPAKPEPVPRPGIFSLTWSNAPVGDHVLTAVAVDGAGASTTSQPVGIQVASSGAPPVVTVTAAGPETMEPDALRDCSIERCLPDPGVFRVTRTGSAAAPLTVFFQLDGTAENGVDFVKTPTTVVIPAGDWSANVLVRPLDDALVEGAESVILRLLSSPEPNDPSAGGTSYVVGRPASAQVVIHDNDSATALHVEIVQPHDGEAFVLGEPIEWVAATPVVPPLAVRVEFLADGVKLGDGVELPVPLVGVRWLGFTWTGAPAGTHTLTARALAETGEVGTSSPVHITVIDPQPLPLVTLETADALASEPGILAVIDTAEFVARRTGDLSEPLTVLYRTGGTAQNGIDFDRLDGVLTFPVGEATARLVVNPLQDGRVEGEEHVVITLTLPPSPPQPDPVPEPMPPPALYRIGTPDSGKALIRDAEANVNTPPGVAIVRPHDDEVFQEPVDITVVGAATDPDGWVSLMEFFADGRKIGEQSIVFIQAPPPGLPQIFSLTWSNVPAGSHQLTVRATDDRGAATTSRSVGVRVAAGNTPPWVSIFAPDPFALEGPIDGRTNTATFRIVRTGPTLNPLRVWYSVHGTAEPGLDYSPLLGQESRWGSVEIPAGRRSVRMTLQPLQDDLPERMESAVLRLEPSPSLSPIEPYRIGLPDSAGVVIADSQPEEASPVRSLTDGSLQVSLPGQDGQAYLLEWSANLLDWAPLVEGVVADGQIRFVDTLRADVAQRFYRARLIESTALPAEEE